VLCGLCVNICRDLLGIGALGFVGRGTERRVATPYDEPRQVCIGCGACAEVCPTGYIRVVDADGEREIVPFKTRHKLITCPECGKGYVTEKQLEHLKRALGERSGVLLACPVCGGRKRAEQLQEVLEVLRT